MISNEMASTITNRFLTEMEKGIIPWQKPWFGIPNRAFNRKTGNPYSFLNQLLLPFEGEYAGLKQWNELGARVKKDEHGYKILCCFPKKIEKINNDGETEIFFNKIFQIKTVFHISQVTGIEPLTEREVIHHDPIEEAEEVKDSYIFRSGIHFTEAEGNRAYYAPSSDSVVVPHKNQFKELEEFYSTVFHELTHSTGAESRLNRINNRNRVHFGDESYSKEELVAEIGAASLVNRLGMETEKSFRNSTAYLESWLSALKNDKHLLFEACFKAEKAVKYILNESTTETE